MDGTINIFDIDSGKMVLSYNISEIQIASIINKGSHLIVASKEGVFYKIHADKIE